jgi:hypothetical protein
MRRIVNTFCRLGRVQRGLGYRNPDRGAGWGDHRQDSGGHTQRYA